MTVVRTKYPDLIRFLPRVVSILMLLFVFVCIFDPADMVLGLKVELFVALGVVTFLIWATSNDPVTTFQKNMPPWLVAYMALFVGIPVLSIIWYFATNGAQPFAGFAMLKGYLLISLVPILAFNKIDLIKWLSAVLVVSAVIVIGVFVFLTIRPDYFLELHYLNAKTGAIYLDRRMFSTNVAVLQMYFATSPMLVIPIAYYFDLAMNATKPKERYLYVFISAICVLGMLFGGSRANILIALLLPAALPFLYLKKKLISFGCGFALVGLALLYILAMINPVIFEVLGMTIDPAQIGKTQGGWSNLMDLFSVKEHSNRIKLAYLKDYAAIFGEPGTLLFGQGLGAYHYWTATGKSFFVTELTYPEMIRNFGLPGAVIMMLLLLLPLWHGLTRQVASLDLAITVAYFSYLVICIPNPNLFSSMGILILSMVLANMLLRPRPKRDFFDGYPL